MKTYDLSLASRLFNAPLLIAPAKLQVILVAVRDRLGPDMSAVEVYEGEPPAEMKAPARQASRGDAKGIAVIDVMGSLVHRARGMAAESGIASYEAIGAAVEMAAADPSVAGILLRIDSPGGEASGAFELARTVRRAAELKPVHSVIDGMGLSAGYLIASQTRKISLAANSSAGSIGIVMIHLDQSEADKKEGLNFTVLKRGARKADFNPHEPLTEGARAWADKLLDYEYGLFVDAVAAGRGLEADKVRALEAGILFGEEAINSGLADGHASYREALEEMLPLTIASPQVKGNLMADLVEQNASPPPVPTGPTAADYEEIASLCAIARRPQLAANFIASRKTVAEVRATLQSMAEQEDAESEVFSPILPKAGAVIEERPKKSLGALMKERFERRP